MDFSLSWHQTTGQNSLESLLGEAGDDDGDGGGSQDDENDRHDDDGERHDGIVDGSAVWEFYHIIRFSDTVISLVQVLNPC